MEVNERIRAVYVLQKFVMMSRQLLPSFSELMSKDNLTDSEELKVDRIKGVYETFHASSELSKELVNSNIFQLIKDVYHTAIKRRGQSPKEFYAYDAFLKESDRLIETWNKQKLN